MSNPKFYHSSLASAKSNARAARGAQLESASAFV